jgi:hypothetical protein
VEYTVDLNRVIDVFIANLPLLITAIFGGIVALKKLNVIHDQTNSMFTVGVKQAKEIGKQEGHEEGVADQKATQGTQRREGDKIEETVSSTSNTR